MPVADVLQIERDLKAVLEIAQRSPPLAEQAALLKTELHGVMTTFRLDLAEVKAARGAMVPFPMLEHLVSLKEEIEAMGRHWLADHRNDA